MNRVSKAVILAGGKGTRFLPYAKVYAKEMLPIGDIPALQFLIREVVSAKIRDILVVINPEKKHIVRYFKDDKKLNDFLYEKNKPEELRKVLAVCEQAAINFVVQETQAGSGNALSLCRNFVKNEPFVFLNGDDLIFAQTSVASQLVKEFDRTNCSVVGVQKVLPADISKYGIADICGGSGRSRVIKEICEKPLPQNTPSDLAFLGRCVFSSSFFTYLDKITPSANGEYLITDAINLQAGSEPVFAYEFDGMRFDLGNKLGFAKASAWNMAVNEKNQDFTDFLKQMLAQL